MSMKKLVSIRQALELAMDDFDDQDTRRLPQYKVWAVKADRKIGSYYGYKKQNFVLDINHCRADLPCQTVAILGLIFGDHGCGCDLLFMNMYSSYPYISGSITPGTGFVVIDAQGSQAVPAAVSYEIQDNQIVFAGDYDGQKCTIQALVYKVDDNGFPMIGEHHVDAVAQYIKLQRAEQSIWSHTETRVNMGDIRYMHDAWNRKCAHARAEDDEISQADMSDIVSLINDPTSGIGMALWRYNDSYYSYAR